MVVANYTGFPARLRRLERRPTGRSTRPPSSRPPRGGMVLVQDEHGVDGVADSAWPIDDHLGTFRTRVSTSRAPPPPRGPIPHRSPRLTRRAPASHVASRHRRKRARASAVSERQEAYSTYACTPPAPALCCVCCAGFHRILTCSVLHGRTIPSPLDRREREPRPGGRRALQPLQRTLTNGDGLVVRRALLARDWTGGPRICGGLCHAIAMPSTTGGWIG